MNIKFFSLFFLSFLVACPALGQVSTKKTLIEADYDRWGTLAVNDLSDKGNWVSYAMTYTTQKDTLFLQRTDKRKLFSFPNGYDGRFVSEELFAYRVGTELRLLNLQDYRTRIVTDIARYDFTTANRYLVTLDKSKILQLQDTKGRVVARLSDVSDYQLSENGTAMVVCYKKGEQYVVACLSLNSLRQTVILEGEVASSRFTWQADKSIAFVKAGLLYYYRLDLKQLHSFAVTSITGYDQGTIADGGLNPIVISHDGSRVFFRITKPLADSLKGKDNLVEVWNGNDDRLYPAQQYLDATPIPRLAVWFPVAQTYKVLSDEDLYSFRLNSKQEYVVLYDLYRHERLPKQPEWTDFYLKNVRTGAERLWLKKQTVDTNQLCFSPTSNAMLYYKDNNWWLYRPETDETVNLTQNISTVWDNYAEVPHQFRVYGCAGWTADGKSVLLNDAYDIWKVSLSGSGGVRLTDGATKKRIYRVSKTEYETIKQVPYLYGKRHLFDLQHEIVMDVVNPIDWSMGYATYSAKSGIRSLVFDHKYIDGLKRSRNGSYVYRTQTFSQPPQLEFVREMSMAKTTLFESNKQQQEYEWGRSELISYYDSKGTLLKGALFYPAGFNPLKKYPMVVQIYDQESRNVHQYFNPTLLDGEGFNVSNYTSTGYFVLLPDIEYTLGAPGLSATDCVTAAVKAVNAMGAVDTKRIGLIGHSFGGYETDFIMTQTNLFATAVSGAGVSDVIRRYFEVNRNKGNRGEMWRFENQQFRLGTSFFNDKKAYQNNNPIDKADAIKVPFLQWTGKKDPVIPWEQSLSLYLALRRLGSPTILLAYPNEPHSIEKAENQKDLNQRIKQWFDYYLKDKTDVGWITRGTAIE
ncbi:prolyl oligopeptidase family serine peptidase [Flavobacterium sp.]|uniref:S9 family peptidase n=1 Tax=Flavobacterium sp. TaxID=239 RepID=UPI00391B0D70